MFEVLDEGAQFGQELGATYAIPIIYVPLLMITHFVAFYLLARPHPKVAQPRASMGAVLHVSREP